MFSPEALNYINDRYVAETLTREEEIAAAAEDPDLQAALDADEHLVRIDGEVQTLSGMDARYYHCVRCSNLVDQEPLTWGVLQWKMLEDEVHCNQCYEEVIAEQIGDCAPGTLGVWPVQGNLDFGEFRHALDDRALATALENAGYEKVQDGGGDTMSPQSTEYQGQSITGSFTQFRLAVRRDPTARFVVTAVHWQFCSDVYLWRKA